MFFPREIKPPVCAHAVQAPGLSCVLRNSGHSRNVQSETLWGLLFPGCFIATRFLVLPSRGSGISHELRRDR